MSDGSGTLALVGRHLVLLFEPLTTALADKDEFIELCRRVGVTTAELPGGAQKLATSVQAAIDAFETEDSSVLFDALKAIQKDFDALTFSDVAIPALELVDRLFQLLVVEYVRHEFPALAQALRALGVIVVDAQAGGGTIPSHARTRIEYGQFAKLFADPLSAIKSAYRWGEDDFKAELVLDQIGRLLLALEVPVSLRELDDDLVDGYTPEEDVWSQPLDAALHVRLMDGFVGDTGVFAAVEMLRLPREEDPETGLVLKKPGLIVQPAVSSQIGDTFELTDNLSLRLTGRSNFNQLFGILVRSGEPVSIRFPLAPETPPPQTEVGLALIVQREAPLTLLGDPAGTRLQAAAVTTSVNLQVRAAEPELVLALAPQDLRLVLAAGDGDGFVSKLVGPNTVEVPVELTVRWSTTSGLGFAASAGLRVQVASHITIGPIEIAQLSIEVRGQAGAAPRITVAALADIVGKFGPVTAVLQNLGLDFELGFTRGNAGPFSLSAGFEGPTGAGIAIDAGPVSGGGFLFFDPDHHRYGGALVLKIYSVTVKAFGLVETVLPDGTPGFSFVVVISAEFTPIQLGLGFTLNGVGGIIGINRRIDEDGLRNAVRTGSLEHLLFPHDVEHEAPQIIHDLAAVLPAAEGRYVFGPMAKIGWGTPTIIQAELGIVLELPGPRLALLGEVSALLPKKDKGLVTLNLSVAGLLDFPKKFFAIDASLHDSRVGSYPISGDMAMRLLWGDNPSFALAVGGFNPGFQPPPTFPALRRVAVDLGVSGNPSITLQGYFAITSNTAQVGALAELRARGSGIDLYGRVQFDALFVFSPFSFEASLSAQVRVSFHGHGIGVHLGGTLSGPSPWRVRGEVCVSILWWDACLGFDKSFGSAARADVPALDPWVGSSTAPPPKEVLGLRDALQDPRNWAPEPSPAAFSVVSFSQAAQDDHPIDPLGVAVVRERVCPLNVQLQRFGSAKATGSAHFVLDSADLNGVVVDRKNITYPQEPFAQGQFLDLSDSQKLSLPSFTKMDGGLRLPANDNDLAPGSLKSHRIEYTTKVLGSSDEFTHKPPIGHLLGMRKRSVTAIDGPGRLGVEAYFDRTAGRKFTVKDELFVVSDRSTFTTRTGILALPTSKALATLVLEQHLIANPDDRGSLQVSPKFEMGGR